MKPAFRVDGRTVERHAFYAAACDPRRSCVVEACAGSGKTWLLVSRILRALLDGAAPHEILAITFTRAAAGEMRQRLDEWLARYAAPRASHAERVAALVERGLDAPAAEAAAPRLAQLQGRLLGAGRPVEIRTFHAWFAQLLRTAPLALLERLGLQPDMTLIEELDEHRAPVLRAFHGAVLGDPGLRADHAALTSSRGRHQLARWLDAAWQKRIEFELADEAGILEASVEPPPAADGSAADRPADVLLGDVWSERLRRLARELGEGTKTSRDAAAGLAAALQADDGNDRFVAAWTALYTRADARRVLGAGSAALSETQAALEQLGERVAQSEARAEHLRMVRLARALFTAYAEYKRASGLADMVDLERCALALLRDSELAGWVQERLDVRIAHLLIDEFQDTSPLQWQALHAWLAGYAGAGGGASGQRPPGVFIVGDPKQSIYRFRRAEPRVFAAATRFVREGLGGSVLACDHTRRNAPTVVAAINAVFSAVPEAIFPGFRAHTTEVVDDRGSAVLALARTERDRAARAGVAAPPAWRDSLTTPRLEPEEVLREREAATVAAALAELVAAGTAGETLVLCRKRESLRLVATALEAEGVAHGAVEDAVLGAAPEAQDLIALLDALVSPAHRLSLARALRSPLFGASDADLLAIAEAAVAHGDWWRALDELAAAGPVLERARRLLHGWRAAALDLPPHDLLDRIVAEGELRERVVAAVPAPQRALALDAIDGVLAQALQLDGGRYATPYGFVRALKRRPIRMPPPVRADAVRLLTIHGAKGLEADTVFVVDADPERAPTETATVLVDWPVEAGRPVRFAFLYSESRCPPSLRALLEVERSAREREELNGLYVAMSRARRRLVFSATEPYLPPLATSWWQRLAPVVGPEPAPGEARATSAAGRRRSDTVPRLQVAPPWRRDGPAEDLRGAAAAAPPAGADDPQAARLGRAVHRVLEWAAQGGAPAGATEIERLAGAAGREFGVAAAPVDRFARAILGHPEGARFFTGRQILWSGNEVPIGTGGEALRIDRLVLVDEATGPVWWVLDYKLGLAPDRLEAYRGQLLRYRDAVGAAEADAPVRCAFIAGNGEVIEIT